MKSVGEALRALPAVGEKAPHFTQLWRDKQLEYSFRKGLMGAYEPFPTCTSEALDYCCEHLEAPLTAKEKQVLLEGYKKLHAFPECKDALHVLQERGHKLFAFSNGTKADVESLIAHAKLDGYFDGIVAVDDMPTPKTFKPDPRAYEYFCSIAGSTPASTCLVSSNPFDIIGSASCGWKTFWVQRTKDSTFDPWPSAGGPSVVLNSLMDLPSALAAAQTTEAGKAGDDQAISAAASAAVKSNADFTS